MNNPIQIGLCGWGDHDIYSPKTTSKDKLSSYAGHFPVVEVDSTYYAIPSQERMAQWTADTPANFRFIVKAYRELTGHGRGKNAPEKSSKEWFADFRDSLMPMVKANKLTAVLMQFPPWFDCKKEHVHYIRRCRQELSDLPLAVEFRNRTWFLPEYYDRTLEFLTKERMIHVICDEPQAGISSVPIVPAVTHPEQALLRFHGRNADGWNQSGRSNEEWREVRYAYRYSDDELAEWKVRIDHLKKEAKQITLLFNNNSRGDAQTDAKRMTQLLDIEPAGLAPRQLDMF
ncbi:Uncharacterized conserved protein YecE, DUF72 family [Marininema mesophilum]|uniref:Uncharacterized conserved protein YecE, DUF72 family n=1 Tax=Marininema mesophilum TaxID=1048340 RepID=A0A1H2YI69_9BACL|nr:DUF72 domain-containing protein [Marininema mesophilum]SDX04239.1 Uncharacterized conserved protein YecE, DUF72 family [Marininema mesophilum]